MAPPLRLPPPPPSRALLLAAVGLGALVLLSSAVAVVSLFLIGDCPAGLIGLACLILAPGTVTLCTLLAARVLRRPQAARRRTMLLHGMLAGALNAVIAGVIVEVIISILALPAVQVFGGYLGGVELVRMVGVHIVGIGLSAVAGGLLGLLFAALLWIPVRALGREPALDARDRFHASVGGWAAGLAAGCAAVTGLASLGHRPQQSFDGPLLVLLVLAVVATAGGALALSALRRRGRCRQWLERVRREQVPSWAVVPAEAFDGAAAAALLPLGPPPHGGVLAIQGASGAVYRHQVALVPVARVRL